MKPLIFVLLAAISVQAQTLADAARTERLRRAQLANSRIFKSEDVRGLQTPLSTIPATTAPPNPVPPDVTEKAVVPENAPVDPAAKYLAYRAELQKIRTQLQGLQDRETETQLRLNELNNQFFAPVTDQTSQAQAQTRIAATQKQLEDVRQELADLRAKLQQLEILGPEK